MGLIWSCEENEPEISEFSNVAYFTSQLQTAKEDWAINVADFITFSDLSRNAISHEWVIPGEGAAYFLEGPLTKNDTILSEFIINPGDTISISPSVNVLFSEPGFQTITLRNVFADSVTFFGRDTIPSVLQDDGTWLYEEDFIVEVYDTIVGSARVFLEDGSEVTLGTDTITLEGGEELRFIDASTGRPDTWSWVIRPVEGIGSGLNGTGPDATIALIADIGVYEAVLFVSRTNEDVPNDFARFDIPNPIKIVASSLPFQLAGTIMEREDQTIQVPMSGAIGSLTGKESFFTVTVNGTPFTISSVAVNATDNTLIDITLDETIYSDDEILVTLASGSGIEATDRRAIVPFSDQQVTMFVLNILEAAGIDASFENGATGFDLDDLVIVPGNVTNQLGSSSAAFAAGEGIDGGGALRINLDNISSPNKPNFRLFTESAFGLTYVDGAQYQISFDYKIEGSVQELTFRLFEEARGFSDRQRQFVPGAATDWTTINEVMAGTTAFEEDNGVLSIQPIGVSGASGTIYIDNLRIFEVDTRP
ncbi:MAG: hypothetical protein AAGA66_06500 [Bacteroidota bacterium]